MKNQKYILHSVAVLAVAALATACSSEEILTDTTSGVKETVTITAYQPNTRVGFDKGGNGYWQAGDKIGVWSTGENKFSSFAIDESGVGKASATFSGTVTDGMGQYAVYPYNEAHHLSENTLTYYLPSSYTYTSVDQTLLSSKNGNSFCMPMYGIVSDDNTVSFKHLGGVICLKIDKMPAGSGTVTVTEVSNKLCGTFTANLTDTNPEINTTASGSNNSVTFNYSNATEGNPGVFYLPVATGTYNLTVKVEGADKEFTTTLDAVEITRTKLHAVKVVTDYGTETEEADRSYAFSLNEHEGRIAFKENGIYTMPGNNRKADDDGTVTYTISDATVATIQSQTEGKVAMKSVGTVTITAKISGSTKYDYTNDTDTFVLTITEEADCYWGYTKTWTTDEIFGIMGERLKDDDLAKGKLPDNKFTAKMTDNGDGTKSFTMRASEYAQMVESDPVKYPNYCNIWWYAIPTSKTIVSSLENGSAASSGENQIKYYRIKNSDVFDNGDSDALIINVDGTDYYVFGIKGQDSTFAGIGYDTHTRKVTIK